MKIKLDKYETEIEKALENGEYVSVSKKELRETKKMFEDAAKNYLKLQKSKPITLRVKNENLLKFKAKAKNVGIPYQRIINTFIDLYANNKIRLAI